MSPDFRLMLTAAVGGAANAWLCYARLPVPVNDDPTFAWHVVPAGAVHGAILATVAHRVGVALRPRSLHMRAAVAMPLGWVAGVLSWIPLNVSVFGASWRDSVTWPLEDGWQGALLTPFQYFGLVALLYYTGVSLGLTRARRLITQITVGSIAGMLGSLWWWVGAKPWYFAIVHGAIWGTLVGIGIWTSQRRATMDKSVA